MFSGNSSRRSTSASVWPWPFGSGMYIDHSTRLASCASILSRWLAAASLIPCILMRGALRTCIPKARNDQCADDRERDDAHRPRAPAPGLEDPAEAEAGEAGRDVLDAVEHSGRGGRR